MMGADDTNNASIIERRLLTDDLMILRVKRDDGPVAPFKPGQWCSLGLPRADDGTSPLAARRPGRVRRVRRAYSIASSPAERDSVELCIVRVPGGSLTPRLWQLPEGGRVWMDDRILGEFTLDPVPADANVLMVATGTGIAPFVSMVRAFRGERRWRRLVVMHGVRLAADLAYREELEQAAHDDPTMLYLPTVTREPADSDWDGLRGRVTALVSAESFTAQTGLTLDAATWHVMLCGNPVMIDDVTALLAPMGFEETRNLHFERYW